MIDECPFDSCKHCNGCICHINSRSKDADGMSSVYSMLESVKEIDITRNNQLTEMGIRAKSGIGVVKNEILPKEERMLAKY